MKQEIKDFIHQKNKEMRQSVINSIDSITLKNLLSNPYFLATFFESPKEFIKFSLESCVMRSMQTKFGNFLENISVEICGQGAKSGSAGIDLDFSRRKRLLISVKSNTKWGNSQSTKKQGDQFKQSQKTISQNGNRQEVITIMGICCDNKKTTNNLQYCNIQVCGQNFWYLISGEKNIYEEIMNEMSVGVEEFEKNRKIKLEEKCEKLVKEFELKYCQESTDKHNMWSQVVKKSLGNFSEDDYILKNIMEKK